MRCSALRRGCRPSIDALAEPRSTPLSDWDDSRGHVAREGAIRGGAALALANGGRQLLRLGVIILLARVLSPAEFGVVAVMTAVFAIASVFQEAGLSAATIQRTRISVQTVSTLFWINATLGVILTLGFMASASLLTDWLLDQQVAPLFRVAAMTFVLNGFAVQHRALLQRGMQFGTEARIDVLASVLGAACALGMALTGWSYWSLVGQILVTDAVALVLVLRAIRFRPGKPRLTSEVLSMLHFGGSLLGFNIVYRLSQNLYIALLGKAVDAAAAGIYTRAFVLANVPQSLLNVAASRVAISKLSRAQGSGAEFQDFYYRGVQLQMLAATPVAAALALFGDQIAVFVYGSQWDGVAPLLRIFAVGLSVAPLLHSTGQIFISRGESRRMLYWGVFGSCVICAGTLAGLGWGVEGVAWGWSGTTVALLWPCLAYAYRGTGLSIRNLLGVVAGIYGSALCMLLVGWPLRALLEGTPIWVQLPLALGMCLLCYIAAAYWLFGQKTLMDSVFRAVTKRNTGAPT